MRLFCFEDHDLPPLRPDRCPPHKFDVGGWENELGIFQSRLFCKACGDIRELEVATIGPPAEEAPTLDVQNHRGD